MIITARTNSPAVDLDMLLDFFEWRWERLLIEYWQTPPLWGRW